jgi:hypothetical protein
MKKLSRITEAEVIAEFLKGEFYQKDYDPDRDLFADIVYQPDLTNDAENSLRRVLLFRRRGSMWWELPEDRQWWEIELEASDLERISVFPRAHWVKLSRGNFQVRYVTERVRRHLQASRRDRFSAKIAAIGNNLQSGAALGRIILLGVDEHRRLVVLEGNHRFIASLLPGGKERFSALRYVCGFSPSMEQCCWYKTNFQTLCRCLKNRIQHYWDRDADVAGLLEQTAQGRTRTGYVESANPAKSKLIS